jgi:hypothetical protein
MASKLIELEDGVLIEVEAEEDEAQQIPKFKGNARAVDEVRLG